ncbi:hypothetical protein [Amycolatopsis sp. CA-230715]|uniref:hypothetical protein n=1 Tax=Amycolatopsis sp. CA-230715 TaxID=2745196 RepID=UPI001C02AE20|nr:hypothetical protein [Amycolatopsis sp. CA-230715]QWF78749.1 hypothetical protein HUW46_02147 [Amycolatopsis sp. CA-230715]
MTGENQDMVEVGRQAYLEGESGSPWLNAAVRAAIGDRPVGTGAIEIMKDFRQGWTEALLANEVAVHFESPQSPGSAACASRAADPEVTANPRAVNCWPCRETEDWRSWMDEALFADELREATETEPDKIVILREVRDKFVGRKIEGVVLDPQTANAIITVYEMLKPELRAKFVARPILVMARVAWKLVRPC